MVKFKRGYLYARAMHTSTRCMCIYAAFFQGADIFMARFLHQTDLDPSRKFYRHLLALCWTAGLGCGVFLWFLADDSVASLMRSSLSGSVSIVGLLSVTFLPFLLSAIAVYFSGPWFLLLICLGKGIVFSFVSMASVASFGGSGWLIRLLLCFSDCLSMPLLYWFWLRCIHSSVRGSVVRFFAAGALYFLIGSIDYCYIVPFLADLMII